MFRGVVFLWCLLGLTGLSYAAPKMELLPFWDISNEGPSQVVDHSNWQRILDRYLDKNHPSGINRFNYAAVIEADQVLLTEYLQKIQAYDPRQLNRAEQKAYWINLYNALTVAVVLKHYPVESIKKTGEGFFSFGPWDDPLARVQGKELSLNQIEHGILRPIWRDNRIHYAVNCASLSCPNLQAEAFTAVNTELLLALAASSYVNHPRGVSFDSGQLKLSSIFDWYGDDFGEDEHALLMQLAKYAQADLAKKLKSYQGDIEYHYNWTLNAP